MGDVASSREWGAVAWRVAWAGALGVALFVLVLLGPALASASPATATLPTGTSPTEAEELAVGSYQDDFDVSKQTAEERLEAQEDGAGIVEQLESSQGKSYAGIWFDNESGEFVVPTVTGSSRASITASLAYSDLEGDFRTKLVQSSWDELEAAQQRIDDALLALIEEGLVGTSLDPKTNAVVIKQAEGANASQRAEVQAAARSASVNVEVRESQEHKLGISLEACQILAAACDAPMRGGVNIVPKGGIRGGGCTAGFKGVGDVYGNRFVLTAGHCIVESGGATKWDSFTVTPEARQPVGQVGAYSFPVHDYAAINANGTYWDKPSWPLRVVYWGVNQEYPINYESASYIGQYACHVGQQSGLSCGTVTGLHLTEPVGGGAYVSNLTRIDHFCSHQGDSGGPVFTPGNVALGIYTGSDKPEGAFNNCYYNGYYTEITEDTDALGVHIAPRIPPPPPPPSWHFGNLGGSTIGDPDIASDQPIRLNVFAQAADQSLHQKWWTGSSWMPWQNVSAITGGKIASGPGAVSWGPGRFDIVARMSDGSVGHWWYDGLWYFDNLGGNIIGAPDIASDRAGGLNVFAQGADENLYQKWWTGSGWTPWQNVSAIIGGKIASAPGAVSWSEGRFDVAARMPGGTLGHFWYQGGSWHFGNLGGSIVGSPDIASDQPGRVNIFARGIDDNLYQKWWGGISWSEWENLSAAGGSKIASGPGAVSWAAGRFDVVARLSDGSIGHWWYGS